MVAQIGNCVICKAPILENGNHTVWLYHRLMGYACIRHHGVVEHVNELNRKDKEDAPASQDKDV